MKNYVYFSGILLLSFLSLTVWGQNYTFRGINMGNGLSDLLVNVIYKGTDGFIWLGTDNCLDRFDGITIKHYPFEGTDGKRKRVNAIAEGPENVLWIGNNAGLWKLARHSELPERMFKNTIDFPVYTLYFDNSGTLFIGTEKGLFILENNELKHILLDRNSFAPANRIKGIYYENARSVWLATANGLYKYNGENKDILSFHSFLGLSGENSFRNIAAINHTLYLGTENQGIFSFDIETSTFSRFVDVGSKIISSLSADGKDMLYVGTDGNGVHFVSQSEKKIIRSFIHDVQDKSSIRSNSVYSLLVDKEGIVWVGFYQAGFDYSMYQNGLFRVYAMPPYFDSMNLTVRSFCINGKEKMIGTRDGLYYINEETDRVKLFQKPELRSNLILSVFYYKGKYYIGTYGGGISIIDSQTLQVESVNAHDAVFRTGHIFCFRKDASNNLWIGTSDGVFAYNGDFETIRRFDHTNSQMPEGNVYDVFFDSMGKGWICTDNGLSIYDPTTGSMRSNLFPEGFFHKEKIRIVYEDKEKNLYFLSDRGGLFTSDLTMSRFESFPIHPTLHGNSYTTILQDDEGWFWLGSDAGMIRMKFGDENFYTFNFSDGIPDPIFMYPSYKEEKGSLWFSNNKGLVFVDPSRLDSIKRSPYEIIVTEIRLKGVPVTRERWVTKSDLLTLKKEENNIGFSFTDLSYSDPNSIIYTYRLEGLEDEWNYLSGANEVNYYDLKPGKYTFRIRVPGDFRSETVVHLKVGSWTVGRWGWLLVIFMVGAAAILFYKFYIKRVKSEQSTPEESREEIDSSARDEKYKTSKLSEKECKMLAQKLKKYMEEEKPYINQELKIGDLAQAMNTSSYALSYLFNQYLDQSYYDYINHYRILEFKQLVNDSQYDRYTLSALAALCGFSSRASFFRSFKKVTGITPNEYIQSRKGLNK